MQSGSELIKIRSNGRQYHRLYFLSDDTTEIRWQPTSKKHHKAKLTVSTIKEVRIGKTTDTLRQKLVSSTVSDVCAFSVIFGEEFESLDLIANTADEVNIWVTGLTCLLNTNAKRTNFSEEDDHERRSSWLHEQFNQAVPDSDGFLTECQVTSLIMQINDMVTMPTIIHNLKEMENKKPSGKKGKLNCDEFITLFKQVSTRPEIYHLLVRYSGNNVSLSTDDLLLFLEVEQGMQHVTRDHCQDVVDTFEPSKYGKLRGELSIDGFMRFLSSDRCRLFDDDHLRVCQDMTHPITHYFIATSHKTYLMEDQLKGPSSVEGYIRALQAGCRCVDVECWDGPNGEPVIYHGNTLTSRITLRSAIQSINEYAFAASEFPVILSLENHCSVGQQQVMATIMSEVFGEKLHFVRTEENDKTLPSPDSLRGCVLLQGRKLSQHIDTDVCYVCDKNEGVKIERLCSEKEKGMLKKQRLLDEGLSDLGQCFVSTRFNDFAVSQQSRVLCVERCWEMNSFSESQALKLAISQAEEFVNHNKRFISRVYPNGMRIDSTNYNPQDFWNCGCQMVALNYQTSGSMMDLYNGWFQKNGGCGYVLKPAVMREDAAYFSASMQGVIPGVSPQLLYIKVISGHNFPKPKCSVSQAGDSDPYVRVEVFGIPVDCSEERTRTVSHNGYNPLFDEGFEFQINFPELALVRFTVLDDDDHIGDNFIGQYTLPFECMQTGYRHVQILSDTGCLIPNSTLFVHIAIANQGGGRVSRRGLSVRRRRPSRDHMRVKVVGVKAVDDTFKSAVPDIREGTELRDKAQVALVCFKDACGLPPISNVKQCIRILANRIHNTSDVSHAALSYVTRDDWPYLEARDNMPNILTKALLAFEELIQQCRRLIENADVVCEKLNRCHQAGLHLHEQLEDLFRRAGLRSHKLAKATECFAWNVRVLRGQVHLMSQAKTDCTEYIQQIKEAAVSTGLDREERSRAVVERDVSGNENISQVNAYSTT